MVELALLCCLSGHLPPAGTVCRSRLVYCNAHGIVYTVTQAASQGDSGNKSLEGNDVITQGGDPAECMRRSRLEWLSGCLFSPVLHISVCKGPNDSRETLPSGSDTHKQTHIHTQAHTHIDTQTQILDTDAFRYMILTRLESSFSHTCTH